MKGAIKKTLTQNYIFDKLKPKDFYTYEIQNSQTQQYIKNLKASLEI